MAGVADGVNSYFDKRKGQAPAKPATPASPTTPSENPIDNPGSYDFIEISGLKTPGVCKLTACDQVYDWDVKAAHGTDGASSTLKGIKLIEASLELTLWEVEHFVVWEQLERILRDSIKGDLVKALRAVHPELKRKGVTSIAIRKIGQLIPKSGGVSTVKVDFLQFKKPTPKPGTGAPVLTTAQKAYVDRVNQLARGYQDLAYQQQQQLQRIGAVEDTLDAAHIQATPEEIIEFAG